MLGHHLLDRLDGRLAPFLGRLLADGVGLLPGLGDDLRGLGLHLGHVLAGLGRQVVEVQRHGVRAVGRIGESDDGSHRRTRIEPSRPDT